MHSQAIAAAVLCVASLSVASLGTASAMSLASGDIADDKAIQRAHIYTRCGGENISPALSWRGAPAGTRSFAVTMIDLDVPPANWTHWIVVDLPPDTKSLPRDIKTLPAGARAIVSNFGDAGYDGPCPPRGTGTHRYRVTVWALPTPTMTFAPDEKATEVQAKLEKAALDKAEITGFVAAPN